MSKVYIATWQDKSHENDDGKQWVAEVIEDLDGPLGYEADCFYYTGWYTHEHEAIADCQGWLAQRPHLTLSC